MLLFNIGPISHALRSENTEKHYHSKLPMGTIMYSTDNIFNRREDGLLITTFERQSIYPKVQKMVVLRHV